MEPTSEKGRFVLPSFFSFSEWKKGITEPKIRRIELALIFCISCILGVALKEIATRSITIGYDDYTVETPENRIDFNGVEQEILSKGGSSLGRENASEESCSQ